MLVDTGNPISILPKEMAQKVFNKERDSWEKGKTDTFQDFNGNPVEQCETLVTDVWLNEWKAERVELLITLRDQNNMPLLGMYLIKKLGLCLTQQHHLQANRKTGQKTI